MTEPEGTLALEALLTPPVVRPELVRLLVAAACVRFTTLGTVTGCPEATISTAAKFHRSDVGAVSLSVAAVPPAGIALMIRCTQ